MFTLVLFIILAAAVSYFVALPLINTRTRALHLNGEASNHNDNDLVEHKEAIYAAIKEIEFDYQMGKLSEADFRELRQQYKDKAIGLLKKIDKVQPKPAPGTGAKVAGQAQESGFSFCWMCGTSVAKEDLFCVNCGIKLA